MANTGYSGEILHHHVVRMRVTGEGNLDLEFLSLDAVNTEVLTSIAMTVTTNKEPTVLGNFREQRAQLRFSVDVINEYFVVSKIIIFIRPIATGYPQ